MKLPKLGKKMIIILSAGIAVVSGFGLHASAAPTSAGNVVVLTASLTANQTLTSADLRLQPWTGTLPKGALTTVPAAVGKRLIYPVQAGQVVLAGDIAKQPMREGLKPHEVGIRIPVTLVSEGGAKAGDYVDVLVGASKNPSYASASNTSTTPNSAQVINHPLLQGVRVVSVLNATGTGTATKKGITTNFNAAVPSAVELAVTSTQAEQLAKAMTSAQLTLVIAPWTQKTTKAGA